MFAKELSGLEKVKGVPMQKMTVEELVGSFALHCSCVQCTSRNNDVKAELLRRYNEKEARIKVLEEKIQRLNFYAD